VLKLEIFSFDAYSFYFYLNCKFCLDVTLCMSVDDLIFCEELWGSIDFSGILHAFYYSSWSSNKDSEYCDKLLIG